jgi:drug/metabolite transporter (DMT)-like permease
MLLFAWIRAEHVPGPDALAWAGAAGVAGAVGLVSLYQALAVGIMGIAAPVSAVIAAAMPVAFAAISQGLPTGWQFIGFGLAMLAVWLISRSPASSSPRGRHSPSGEDGRPRGLGLAALAGIGFGGFYIFISRARTDVVFWPLAASQFITLLTVLAFAGAALLGRRENRLQTWIQAVPLMLLAGLLDAGGNAFFLLAEHAGRLDVAAVLASLYPASTVVLARMMLNEQVSRAQALGIIAALLSIPLIAV